ncbi:MAG: Glucose-6-phosphate isomerase, partial [uncultured Sulfurovum sp.]
MKNKIYFNVCERQTNEKQKLFSAIEKERSIIGYYNLPAQNIDTLLEYANTFDESIENIVVLGIGGSSLGARAIYAFLKPVQQPTRKLFFFESTDPLNIMDILSQIDIEKSHF